MLAAGMPAYFAMDHTRDREVGQGLDTNVPSLIAVFTPKAKSIIPPQEVG